MAKGNYGVNSLGGTIGGGGKVTSVSGKYAATTSLKALQSMSDDEFADFLSSTEKTDTPFGTMHTNSQKIVQALGLHDKPIVVSDSELDDLISQNGTPELFHSMDYVDNDEFGRKTATEIQESTMYGDYNVLSNGTYGRGTYFADTYERSTDYGTYDNDIERTAIIRATLSPNANVVDDVKLEIMIDNRAHVSDKLGNILKERENDYPNRGYSDNFTAYALKMGYNVIKHNDYYCVIDRSALIISQDVKPVKHGGSWNGKRTPKANDTPAINSNTGSKKTNKKWFKWLSK